MDYQGIMWAPSVKSLRDRTRKSLGDLRKNLAALKHQDSTYAKDHRMLIALYEEIETVVDRHAEQAGTILPAPSDAA